MGIDAQVLRERGGEGKKKERRGRRRGEKERRRKEMRGN